MRNLEVKIRYVLWAFKRSFEPSECYSVEYKGLTLAIKPAFTGWNKWHLYYRGHDKIAFSHVCGNELKVNLISFNRWFNNFKRMYKFQKWSWYSIDCRKPFLSGISYINSDNIKN